MLKNGSRTRRLWNSFYRVCVRLDSRISRIRLNNTQVPDKLGKPRRLTDSPATDVVASWSGDGKWIYFGSNRSGDRQIWKCPVDGGEARQITRKGGECDQESPDRQWVYYTKGDRALSLWKVPKEGGQETQVLESVNSTNFSVVKEGIYFVGRSNQPGRSSIQVFRFATQKIRVLTTFQGSETSLSVSPDGRWILYSQIDQVGSDLMLVENFR